MFGITKKQETTENTPVINVTTVKVKENEWKDLQIFTPEKGRVVNEPVITINKSGLHFNKNVSKNFIKEKTYAKIMYSKAKHALVIEFKDLEAKGIGFKLNKNKNQSMCSITTKSLFNKIKFDEKTYGKYLPKFEEIPGIGKTMVIFLNKSIRRRKKKNG